MENSFLLQTGMLHFMSSWSDLRKKKCLPFFSAFMEARAGSYPLRLDSSECL